MSGGVGGARLARGLTSLSKVDLTVVVNVGDDDVVHGLYVSPDLDTVTYTLAGIEGPEGWGRASDTFAVNEELARFGVDNRFQLGDLDLALNIYRTDRRRSGDPLSAITRDVTSAFDIEATVLPSTDDRLATEVRVEDGGWLSFLDYFVLRANRDVVKELRFAGASQAVPAPGVLEAIDDADLVVIGPSNPPLSLWPILAVEPIKRALADHPRVIAISPLVNSKALKGPAARVMASLGLASGNRGVVEAYEGIIDTLVIHDDDASDASALDGVAVVTADTLIKEPAAASAFAARLLDL